MKAIWSGHQHKLSLVGVYSTVASHDLVHHSNLAILSPAYAFIYLKKSYHFMPEWHFKMLFIN